MPSASPPIVFITGASAGFGAAIAQRFAESGARLVLAARRLDRLQALAAELRVPSHLLRLDVRDRAAVERAVADLPADFADVSVLVNNAGGALGLEPAHQANIEDWEALIDTNVKGLLYVTRAILPGMVARDHGHIINIGSVAGSYPYPGGNVYGGTKAFVEQFSLNLRADLLGKRVRVTNLEPGMAETEFSLVRFKGDAEKASAIYRDFPALKPADVAEVVHFCASLPEHVNVNRLEMMSVMQSFAGFALKRS